MRNFLLYGLLLGLSFFAGLRIGSYSGYLKGGLENGIASNIATVGIGVSLRSQLRKGQIDQAMGFIEKTLISQTLEVLRLEENEIPSRFRESYENVKQAAHSQ